LRIKEQETCLTLYEHDDDDDDDDDRGDQDIEVCVLKLKSTFFNVCIMAVSRVPTGNFYLFLNKLHDIIKTLHKVDVKLVVT